MRKTSSTGGRPVINPLLQKLKSRKSRNQRVLGLLVAMALSGVAAVAWAQGFPNILRQVVPQIAPPATPPQQQQSPQAQPSLGTRLTGDASLEEEVAIGRQLAGNLLGAAALVKDDRLQNYVNKVGRHIALQSERPDLNWYFGVLETNDINAFALPGGYVFVTKGLYATFNNEAELAGVLAHVVQKHHLKLYQQSNFASLGRDFIGSRIKTGSAVGNMVAQNALGNGAEALARGLDKGAEHEADRMGVVLATRAGYDPYGLPIVLQRLGQLNPASGSVALMFKTHPLPQERLVRLGEAMGDSFDKYSDGKTLPDRLYAIKK